MYYQKTKQQQKNAKNWKCRVINPQTTQKSIYKTTNMKNKQTNRHGNVINQAPWGRGDDGEAPG